MDFKIIVVDVYPLFKDSTSVQTVQGKMDVVHDQLLKSINRSLGKSVKVPLTLPFFNNVQYQDIGIKHSEEYIYIEANNKVKSVREDGDH